jgi:glycosyltransferase involved in cell wall biosynthesis
MASGWSVRRKAAIVAVARARRLPVVLHLHGADLVEDIGDGGRLHRATFRRAARAASRVVVLSEYWAEWIARIEPRARAVVVRNAVALPPAVAPLAPEPTVLFLGRLGERKGIWTLLDCMDEVVAAVPDVRFVLAGDGDVDGVRARLDARPGHAARTEVLGWVPPAAVGSLIDRCWVLALPSRNEGLPMSVLETMARGRPVVATRVGGIPDAVRDGTDGSLIEPDDAAALAARLADLLSDRARCTAMGAAARERIRDRYDLDEAHRTMASIYREVAR